MKKISKRDKLSEQWQVLGFVVETVDDKEPRKRAIFA
jgi:hypothetical protein